MQYFNESTIRSQLTERRHKLNEALARNKEMPDLHRLLNEVDLALERMDNGTYGLCETCHDEIEPERLAVDPLLRFCLDHLNFDQQRALEQDLVLASQIQGALLPKRDMSTGIWDVSYHYKPAGPVSGDYCDLVSNNNGELFFILGDVSGKGVSASMLMTHLHAIFHSLVTFDLSASQLMEKVNSLFCESTLSTHYATLVCGKTGPTGEVEICNAGHPPIFQIRDGEVLGIEATGLPIGLFCNGQYTAKHINLAPGEKLFLYTDGLSESWNEKEEYGIDRIARLAGTLYDKSPALLISSYMKDLSTFMSGLPGKDDLSMLVIQRSR